MPRIRSLLGVTCLSSALATGAASPAAAQPAEITPLGGFRVGGGFFETSTGRPIDPGAAPAVGVAVDIPLSGGLQFEAAFSHERADLSVVHPPSTIPARLRVVADHYQAGGLQEFGSNPRARPFLTGVLGLTRYASEGDNQVRFLVGAGGGIKLFSSPRVGVRLDGRVFTTIIDANGTGLACGAGTGCLIAL